jgi:hypothetical protein
MTLVGPPPDHIHAIEETLEVVIDRGEPFLHSCHQRNRAQGKEPSPWCVEDMAVVIEPETNSPDRPVGAAIM